MTEQWQELKETITEMRDNDGTGTQQDACKFLVDYMEVLEKQMQEPCEDCISRQKALDCFEQTNTRQGAKYAIETLPSVKPKYTDEEIDKAQAVEQAYVDKMVELAVEETKRLKGKWIKKDVDYYKAVNEYGGGVNEDTPYFVDDIACSKCLKLFSVIDNETERFNYCPNCGAYMGGGEDEG